jgi:hypothetical protein
MVKIVILELGQWQWHSGRTLSSSSKGQGSESRGEGKTTYRFSAHFRIYKTVNSCVTLYVTLYINVTPNPPRLLVTR